MLLIEPPDTPKQAAFLADKLYRPDGFICTNGVVQKAIACGWDQPGRGGSVTYTILRSDSADSNSGGTVVEKWSAGLKVQAE